MRLHTISLDSLLENSGPSNELLSRMMHSKTISCATWFLSSCLSWIQRVAMPSALGWIEKIWTKSCGATFSLTLAGRVQS